MTDFTITEDFPKSEIEFDARFSDPNACYDYLFKQKWAFSKKWTHRTAKLYEATGGVPPWENGLAKSLKSKRCGWPRSQATPNPESNAILA